MALMEKYQSLVDLANQLGISGLNTQEDNGVLHIDVDPIYAATRS